MWFYVLISVWLWIGTPISQGFRICMDLWSYISIRELQITTDCSVFTYSVFRMLFAYFDDSMGSIGGYETWKSCNIVDITPI